MLASFFYLNTCNIGISFSYFYTSYFLFDILFSIGFCLLFVLGTTYYMNMDDDQSILIDYNLFTSDGGNNDDEEANEQSVPYYLDGQDEDDEQLVPVIVDEDGPLNNQEVETFPTMVYTEEMEEQEGEIICTVCQSELKAGETIIMLPDCSDNFHAECVENWLEISRTCPNCRQAY